MELSSLISVRATHGCTIHSFSPGFPLWLSRKAALLSASMLGKAGITEYTIHLHYSTTTLLAFTINLFRSGPVETIEIGTPSSFSIARR